MFDARRKLAGGRRALKVDVGGYLSARAERESVVVVAFALNRSTSCAHKQPTLSLASLKWQQQQQ